MATISALLQDPDFMEMYKQVLANSRWQNQLASGLGIANAGWKTALGLNIGTALGNWLGHKLYNYQRAKEEPPPPEPPPQEKFPNVFGNVDLGWTPPPYQFLTAEEYIKDAPQVYNQNWRQNMINRAMPIPYWRPNLNSATTAATATPTPQTLAPTPINAPQTNYSNALWGYRPLTEGSLKPRPAMSIQEAFDKVLPNYGLSRW